MSDKFAILSLHATSRIEERFDLEKADAQHLADRAWAKGKTFADYSGKARKYLYDIQTKYKNEGYVVKSYANKLFVFSKNKVLCTVYPENPAFKKMKGRLPIYRENTSYDNMYEDLIA